MWFGFLVGMQLARGLGAAGYGVYGLAMSIIAILTVPAEFGLPQLLTREVAAAQGAGKWGRVRGVLGWSIRASMMLAVLISAGVLAWLASTNGFATELGRTMLAGLVLVPVVALLSLHSAALRGAQQIVSGQIPEVVLRPAFHSFALLLALLLAVPLTPALAMLLGVLSAAFSLFVAYWLLRRTIPQAALSAVIEVQSKQWWASAAPMAMSEGMRVLQTHLLIFLLGVMVSMEEVGIFRVAASTALLVSMPISLFNVVSMPIIARLHAAGERYKLQRMLTLISVGMTVSVLLLSLPFLVAGEQLLGRIFGQEFVYGAVALSLLCVPIIVNALVGPAAALLNMTGHQKHVTVASLAALLVLAVASPPLIIGLGISGAAIASILSISTWCLIMWRTCRHLLGLDPGVVGMFFKLNGKAS